MSVLGGTDPQRTQGCVERFITPPFATIVSRNCVVGEARLASVLTEDGRWLPHIVGVGTLVRPSGGFAHSDACARERFIALLGLFLCRFLFHPQMCAPVASMSSVVIAVAVRTEWILSHRRARKECCCWGGHRRVTPLKLLPGPWYQLVSWGIVIFDDSRMLQPVTSSCPQYEDVVLSIIRLIEQRTVTRSCRSDRLESMSASARSSGRAQRPPIAGNVPANGDRPGRVGGAEFSRPRR